MSHAINVEKTGFLEFLRTLWRQPDCQLCGANDWNISTEVFELRQYQIGEPATPILSRQIFPVIPVICGCCGQVILVGAITAGVLSTEGTAK